jgi:ABC-type polysaccharide/polyol phosphate transport system ATPase subunit
MTDETQYAVKVDTLTKTFKIPTEASSGLKQKLINILKRKKGYREFTPLSDISFDIHKGEFFGIAGRNGSGKSTLLKSMANIYTPTKGAVHVNGSLIPFIELGVGFNPELTGRENVFLNGALLGFSHSEMEAMYDDIVSFAEIGDFMEEKLKNYSSGMQVRLAFSIAIKAEGDILLLDEVLAVGDEAFQQKCFNYFEKLKAEKKTVILVTHDMAIVKRFCTRAMLLVDGKIKDIGDPERISEEYSKLNQVSIDNSMSISAEGSSDEIDLEILDTNLTPTRTFNTGDTLKLHIKWEDETVKHVGVALLKQTGERMYATNSMAFNYEPTNKSCEYSIDLNVGEGGYLLRVRLFGEDKSDIKHTLESGTDIRVKAPKSDQDGLVLLYPTWSNLK